MCTHKREIKKKVSVNIIFCCRLPVYVYRELYTGYLNVHISVFILFNVHMKYMYVRTDMYICIYVQICRNMYIAMFPMEITRNG